MIKKLKTKQDFVKALNQSEFKFLEVKRNSQRTGYPCPDRQNQNTHSQPEKNSRFDCREGSF
jgi:hypothetical protein